MKLIINFANKVRLERGGSPNLSDEDILAAMRLGKIVNGEFNPNNVCAILFATDPRQVFPGAYVHFLRYNGTEEKTGKEYNVIKDRVIEGNIIEIIRDTASVMDANLREFTEYRAGKFFQTAEYPHDAWYELLVNACVHRSYHAKTQPIFVKMLDDHLIVESPGGFMPSISPDNFYHKPPAIRS